MHLQQQHFQLKDQVELGGFINWLFPETDTVESTGVGYDTKGCTLYSFKAPTLRSYICPKHKTRVSWFEVSRELPHNVVLIFLLEEQLGRADPIHPGFAWCNFETSHSTPLFTLYTSRKSLQHLLATGVSSCEEPGSAHEQTCKISREELPHPIKQRRDELRKKIFFGSLPLWWRLLISVNSCAEWGWPDILGTIQGAIFLSNRVNSFLLLEIPLLEALAITHPT